MVEVRGVDYGVGDVAILEGVDAAFAAGRFNVILGPNGAGKSTLLKIAAGLLPPSAGEVLLDGRALSSFESEELARTRAMLSQHVELAFPLPVGDVVLMGRYPHYGRSPTARDREIQARALELVGMAHKRDQAYPTLSGGEKQKVQLARVLAQIWNFDEPRRPKYLFLDEPTSSLDVHYQLHLLDVARDLLAYECTVVAILHDINVALRYGDAFLVLERGRVATAAVGPDAITADLLERVFGVRAHRAIDAADGQAFWRFSLS